VAGVETVADGSWPQQETTLSRQLARCRARLVPPGKGNKIVFLCRLSLRPSGRSKRR
jgi:hypothetical protein